MQPPRLCTVYVYNLGSRDGVASFTALWGKDGTGDVHKGSNLHHVQRAIFAFLRQKHQHRSTQQEVCEKSEDTKGPQASSTRENPPDEGRDHIFVNQ